jgi:hypothetical protein
LLAVLMRKAKLAVSEISRGAADQRKLVANVEPQDRIAGTVVARLEPEIGFAAPHCGLADSLAYGRRYDETIERSSTAIELSPNDPQLWAFPTYGALALCCSRALRKLFGLKDRRTPAPAAKPGQPRSAAPPTAGRG